MLLVYCGAVRRIKLNVTYVLFLVKVRLSKFSIYKNIFKLNPYFNKISKQISDFSLRI